MGFKISEDPATGVVAQGASGDLATCDPAQSVSTQGTLGRSPNCGSSGGADSWEALMSRLDWTKYYVTR